MRVSNSPVIAVTTKFSSSTISPSRAAETKVIVPAAESVSAKSLEFSFEPFTYTLIYPDEYPLEDVNTL